MDREGRRVQDGGDGQRLRVGRMMDKGQEGCIPHLKKKKSL